MSRTIEPRTGRTESNALPRRAQCALPPAVSRSQAYYWTAAWQRAEEEALAEIAAGKARTFDDARSAIAHLLDPDD